MKLIILIIQLRCFSVNFFLENIIRICIPHKKEKFTPYNKLKSFSLKTILKKQQFLNTLKMFTSKNRKDMNR